MIKYQLVCDGEHEFEGWFGDSSALKQPNGSDMLQCPVCGNADGRSALMGPYLASAKTPSKAGNTMTPPPDASPSGLASVDAGGNSDIFGGGDNQPIGAAKGAVKKPRIIGD